jgi:hypothetical protein
VIAVELDVSFRFASFLGTHSGSTPELHKRALFILFFFFLSFFFFLYSFFIFIALRYLQSFCIIHTPTGFCRAHLVSFCKP